MALVLKHLVRLILVIGVLATVPAHAESTFEWLVSPGDLARAHAELQSNCQNCHEGFSQGAQSEKCLACHKPVAADVTARAGFHGRSAEVAAHECSFCHTDHQGRDAQMVAFDLVLFDHGTTDFALVGRHAALDCASCHPAGRKFRDAATDCFACHAKDDAHQGRLGRDCAACHGPAGWTGVGAFDHARTGFRLDGSHADLPCVACHAGEVYKGVPKDCVGCHAVQDPHGKALGADCASCHGATRWTEVRFDHDRDTAFALKGAHRAAKCETCHAPGTVAKGTRTDCASCHAADDVHKTALGADCASCHSESAWAQDIRFDHDLSRMPLLGQHAVLACEACHMDRGFQIAEVSCVSCHAEDDTHKAALGPACASCHTPAGWAFWRFDHDTQTTFALTGKHDGLACAGCHAPGTDPARVATDCLTCHRKDDVHKGRFGPDCAACHTTASFKDVRLK